MEQDSVAVDQREPVENFIDHIDLVSEESLKRQNHDNRFLRWQEAERKADFWREDGLMGLPRELRDEVYRYLVPHGSVLKIQFAHDKKQNTDRAVKVRLRGPLEAVYRAYPSLLEEVREAYFRHNIFLFAATKEGRDHFPVLQDWINLEGAALSNIERFQVKCYLSFFDGPTVFDIRAERDGALAVTSIGAGSTFCLCPIQDKVHERLSRQDAMDDQLWLKRIEESSYNKPVFLFALQLVEAARMNFTKREDAGVHGGVAWVRCQTEYDRKCEGCDGVRWVS